MFSLINKNSQKELNEKISQMHPADILDVLESLDDENNTLFYSLISEQEIARIISFLEPEDAAQVIFKFKLAKQKEIIDHLELDDAADILVHLDSKDNLLETLDDKEALTNILEYSEDLVGSHMNDSFISLKLGMDIKEATKKVIKEAGNVETLNQLFVVDSDEHFVGVISLKKLIKSKAPLLIDELVKTTPYVLDISDIEEAIHKIESYGLYEMAVLNNDLKLIGILTVDDAIEIYHEEAIEDYEKLAALSDTTEKSLFKQAFRRITWLLLLLVLSIPIALATSQFEEIVMAVAILAFFQPLILDAGGDVATQTLAVTLRILTKDEKQALKNGSKEIMAGAINGVILGFSGFVISYLIGLVLVVSNPLLISLVVGLALTLTIIVGPVFALFIPIILNKMKIDPAVASGPFITTLIDITSVFIYFGLAVLLLGGMLS